MFESLLSLPMTMGPMTYLVVYVQAAVIDFGDLLQMLIPVLIELLSPIVLALITFLSARKAGLPFWIRSILAPIIGFFLAAIALKFGVDLPETLEGFNLEIVMALLGAVISWLIEKSRQTNALAKALAQSGSAVPKLW